jgi:hypothetical protein
MPRINSAHIAHDFARPDKGLSYGRKNSPAAAYSKFAADSIQVAHPRSEAAIRGTIEKLYRERTAPLLIFDLPVATVREFFPGHSLNGSRTGADGKTGHWYSAARKRSLNQKDWVRVVVNIKPKDRTRLHDKEPEFRLLALYDPAGAAERIMPKGYNPVHELEAHHNPKVLKAGRVRRGFARIAHRYSEYGQGAADTLSAPKSMGLILANLGVTSITLSAFLYGMLYLLDYATVEATVCAPPKPKHKHVNAASQVDGPAAMLIA